MMPIRMNYSNANARGELVRNAGYIVNDAVSGVDTAVIVSLFSDETWWGNDFDAANKLGSRISKLVSTGKITDLLLARVRDEAEAALHWLIDDDVVDKISVDVFRHGDTGVMLTIATTRKLEETALVQLIWEAFSDANN